MFLLRNISRGACRLIVAALFAGLPNVGFAAETGASAWARIEHSAVRLIVARSTVGPRGEVHGGLEFELQPGWKTYWRSPGDAGFPVTVDWSGSRNVAAVEMMWPAPHRFSLFGLDTFGYESHVVLPLAVRAADPAQPLALDAKINYLVCEDICIPVDAVLRLDVPAGSGVPTEHAQTIARYVAQVPGNGALQGLSLEGVRVQHQGDVRTLEVTARSTVLPFATPDLIVEAPQGLYFAAPALRLEQDGRLVHFSLPIDREATAPPVEEAELTLTLIDGTRGLEKQLVVGSGFGAPSVSSEQLPPDPLPSLLAILLVALLGGLILNVMPCVLPVLSLKLLGLIGHDGEDSRRVRLGFIASAAGILTAFAGLAGVLATLKGMGSAVGWGIQFQQPWFLIAMILLLTGFAANLWGWFEIPLPAFVGRAAGIGGHASLGGQFATGVFATLLATPCSAPFVGTAIAFALARGAGEIFAVFLALGLGFAAPYLLVAALPGIARLLPRPGRWMIGLRRLLGLLLAGTAVWLLTVLSGVLDDRAVWLIGGLVVAMAAALWARHHLPAGVRAASPAVVLALGLAAFIVPTQIASSRAPLPAGAPAGFWQPFDQSAIARLVAEGKTVFVDVTANWCVTCIFNKQLIVESAAVQERLTAPAVVAMQADWTRPDDRIARYLAANNRYGIPFNAVYGPGAPQGIVLPELLSEAAVLDALQRAAGG
jgi:suppressor for copper-sensitivity B